MALGSNLEVEGANQVVLGRYNAGNSNSKLIVGAGFSNANRINAFEVKNTSQLKLGKYGQTPANFPAPSPTLTNVLVVGVANNVTEIPISNAEFNSQLLPPGTRSVTAGSTTNLSSQEEKIVKKGQLEKLKNQDPYPLLDLRNTLLKNRKWEQWEQWDTLKLQIKDSY